MRNCEDTEREESVGRGGLCYRSPQGRPALRGGLATCLDSRSGSCRSERTSILLFPFLCFFLLPFLSFRPCSALSKRAQALPRLLRGARRGLRFQDGAQARRPRARWRDRPRQRQAAAAPRARGALQAAAGARVARAHVQAHGERAPAPQPRQEAQPRAESAGEARPQGVEGRGAVTRARTGTLRATTTRAESCQFSDLWASPVRA